LRACPCLPLQRGSAPAVGALRQELYLHGVSAEDIAEILRRGHLGRVAEHASVQVTASLQRDGTSHAAVLRYPHSA